ncbi:MAG: hypothetical protein CBC91_05865 [Rickettsiales bacterium TMED131]|nr:MAG: hypothetical protein CBC91_05865 [Rickettsiales bacterium TMED131]
MAKIDKSLYSKEEWLVIRNRRRLEKQLKKQKEQISYPVKRKSSKVAFVLGNGVSRAFVEPEVLSKLGVVYGCNALYRTFAPDYLIAVDVKMILEISKSGYQNTNTVWSNHNKAYSNIKNINYFQPSKGWSSGPTALWLAAEHGYDDIYILGFDYKGLDDHSKFNNLYADTKNYKKSNEGATFYGNWLRQTKTVIRDNKKINFTRVIAPDNYQPIELNNFENYNTIHVGDFQKIFDIS